MNEINTFGYEQAIEYIHTVNWCFCKPGLERIGELCRLLGDPQNELKFVHVVGTNGKGSFCAMLDQVLRTAGYKTGLFTSPYVRVFNERMMYMGENISNDELAEITYYVKGFADTMTDKPTEFELITAIAFEYFRRKKCDLVILEAGMGGRLDSTNIITTPLLSVITGVALDHTAYLGDTVEKIAEEKAGVIKHGVPVLFGGNDEVAARVIRKKADRLGSELYITDRDAVKISFASVYCTAFEYKDMKNILIKLLGLYQPYNAANVIEAVRILGRLGYEISEQSLRSGLLHAVWHARFEMLSEEPIIMFDGSHNPEGIRAAVDTIACYFAKQKVRILTGVMADKDYSVMCDAVSEVAGEVYTVKPNNPRALSAEELAKMYRERGIKATAFESVQKAIDAVISADNSIPTIALGSLYMYCEVVDALEARNIIK